MALPEYENLTKSELIAADHYAETGNNAGLRRMREISKARKKVKIDFTEEELKAIARWAWKEEWGNDPTVACAITKKIQEASDEL